MAIPVTCDPETALKNYYRYPLSDISDGIPWYSRMELFGELRIFAIKPSITNSQI